jgi:HEAT repeat protein
MSEIPQQDRPVSDWLKLLGSEDQPAQQEAVGALTRLGPAAVPDLIQALTDDDWQVRNEAAVALGAIGPEAKAAVPSLIAVLQSEDKNSAVTAPWPWGKSAGTPKTPFRD